MTEVRDIDTSVKKHGRGIYDNPPHFAVEILGTPGFDILSRESTNVCFILLTMQGQHIAYLILAPESCRSKKS